MSTAATIEKPFVLTLALDAPTRAWLSEQSAAAGLSADEFVTALVAETRAHAALEAVAAWARDDGDAPSIDEVALARAQMLGEE